MGPLLLNVSGSLGALGSYLSTGSVDRNPTEVLIVAGVELADLGLSSRFDFPVSAVDMSLGGHPTTGRPRVESYS